MRTLSELQQAMESDNEAEASKAGKELAEFYFTYNQEYNALLIAKQRGEIALDKEKHNGSGVNTSDVFKLQSMILGIASRIAMLDHQMLAFQESAFAIRPPGPDTINKVKELSSKVAKAQIRANTVEAVMKNLTELAQVTSGFAGA